jgi:ubiquinol-cytochrome c reductase iron-sulfur subunit
MSAAWNRLSPSVLRYGASLSARAASTTSTVVSRAAAGTPTAFSRAAVPGGFDARDRYAQARQLASKEVTTSAPTISSAGIIGPGDPSQNAGPGALATGYIDDYHNHSHRNAPGDPTKRAFTYMVLGTTKFIAASAARLLVLKLIYTMSASADVLAKGSVEVELGSIPLGTTATLKWRGKPVFIRHRTPDEIALGARDDNEMLRDPEADLDRVQKPEWVRFNCRLAIKSGVEILRAYPSNIVSCFCLQLIVLGVCTHLGCVPLANPKGFFCPCHGSHYDVSGRIRKGPAPTNLEVPTYKFIENDTKVVRSLRFSITMAIRRDWRQFLTVVSCYIYCAQLLG